MPKIIIIEDDNDILDVMTYILTEEGYEVIASPNSTPLSQLDRLQPFLILMDNRLIEGTGTELCFKLKNDPATAHFPVAIISAHNNLEEIAKESRADAFLKKPFDIDELLALVKRFD
jgi:DNA-binding response OmpR family regulator